MSTDNRRGHRLKTVEVEITCATCPTVFTCLMTTKPLRYCPACRVVRNAEKAARDIERDRIRRTTPPSVKTKERRKIPYAGYDKGE